LAQLQTSLAVAIVHGQAVAKAKKGLLQQQSQNAAMQQQRLGEQFQAEEADA